MTDSRATAVPALVLTRTYDAPPERVYAAWTDPKIAAKFMGPGKVRTTEIAMDVRVGGKFRIVMLLEDGSEYIARGTYTTVQPPNRLSMTWTWEEDNPAEEHETLLTLDFLARGAKTELVLTHETLSSVESRSRHEEGWNAILDQLASIP